MGGVGMEGGIRVYRPGATIVPLFFWALMCSGVGMLFLEVARESSQTSEARGLAWGLAALTFVLGPAAFGVCLLRLCLVRVALDPREGLLLSGGRRRIPWKDIDFVRFHKAPLQGLIRGSAFLHFITVGGMALIYYVILPSLALFTPWPPRVIVGLKDGQSVVLRDLRRCREFTEAITQGLLSASRGDAGA